MIGHIFSRLVGVPLASDRALLDVLCLAASADGASSALEEGYMLELALDLAAFRRYDRDELARALADARRDLDLDGGRGASIARIASQLDAPELAEQGFTLAAVVVGVDQKVLDAEQGFLGELRAALGLSAERGRAIWREIEAELASLKPGETG